MAAMRNELTSVPFQMAMIPHNEKLHYANLFSTSPSQSISHGP